MLIKSEFHIWEAAATDEDRVSLQYVAVVKDQPAELNPDGFFPGLAFATDGFILAVVPVLFAEHDIEGLVSTDALKRGFQAAKRLRLDPVRLHLDQPGYVGLVDNSLVPRWADDAHEKLNYPAVASIIPAKRPTVAARLGRGFHLMSAALQPGYYSRLVKAIGCKFSMSGRGSGHGSGFARIVFGSVSDKGQTFDPMIVEPQAASVGEGFVPPYGIIMPMYAGGGSGREAVGVDWDQKSSK